MIAGLVPCIVGIAMTGSVLAGVLPVDPFSRIAMAAKLVGIMVLVSALMRRRA